MHVLLVVSVLFALFGLVMVIGNRKNLARRRRMLGTPTTAVSKADGGGPVEVIGRVVPSEEGVLPAPFRQTSAVWVRSIVYELVQSGDTGDWIPVFEEQQGLPFFLDDGSGQMARVLPRDAALDVAVETFGGAAFKKLPRHIEAFLDARGLPRRNMLGMKVRTKCTEELIEPGETIFALGPSRREAGPPVPDRYREASSTVLVMYGEPGPAGGEAELLLSSTNETQLQRRYLATTVGGWICLGIAVATSVAYLAR